MKNIKLYNNPNYQEKEYHPIGDGIYQTKDKEGKDLYVLSLSFIQEPEKGEGKNAKDISQYPLEDILDTYHCHISDFYEELNQEETCYLEFASYDEKKIKELTEIIGKHVYNQEEGNRIKLKVEDIISTKDVEKKIKSDPDFLGISMIFFLILCMVLIFVYLITNVRGYAYAFLASFAAVMVCSVISNQKAKKKETKRQPISEGSLRREKSNQIIQSKGITCFENLPFIEESSEVQLKDLDTICRRALASIIVIQLACEIKEGKDESHDFCTILLKKYGVKDDINEKEKRVIEGKYSNQDLIDLDWEYEDYWALVWALGLIDDITDATDICDCDQAVHLALSCKNLEEFKRSCNLRDVSDILDMLDLYYRYHWAVVEKQINPETKIGNLDSSVVIERRRALEWLFSEEEDWYHISLDT